MNGWIKLHRQLIKWEWWDDHNTTRLFIYLLLEANHEDKKWQGVTVKRGQKITSYPKLSKNTGISIQSVRTSLNKLKSTGELTVKPQSKYTVISISNYDSYQENNTQINRRLTVNQQATNNKQEGKEVKKIRIYISEFNKFFGSKYKPTGGRTKKLALRLKTFSLEDLLKAMKNLSASDWHTGKNDRGWKADPDFLIRSDEQIDKWLNIEPEKEVKPKRYVKLLSEEK